ncbi:hypothetical protein [Flavobacterium hydatis]|nr:hypothetical protein [Flavobacterium hydatis]
MKIFLILVFIFVTPIYMSAQHDVTTKENNGGQSHEFHDPIGVEGRVPERGPKGEPGGKGGSDGGKKTDAGPNTTVQVGAGKVLVSQKAANQMIALLQEYFGTDFWSSLFSPSSLPTNGMETQMIERIRALATEAALDNRPADAKFFNDTATNFLNKSSVKMQFTVPSGSKQEISLNEPLIYHNVAVRTPAGTFAGMVITIPGFMSNAQGNNAELLVRFYTPNGRTLYAHPNETFYRDITGLVVTGTGVLPITNKFVDLSSRTFQIPYYALNLMPTNGSAKYEILAKASLYINNIEVMTSQYTQMLINY